MPDTILASKTKVAFTLDGVSIRLDTSFLPGETFIVSQPGQDLQAAIWTTSEPAGELAIVAAPFGMKPPTENVPPAGPGLEGKYHEGFDKAREEGEVDILARTDQGPTITIFGRSVVGRAVLAAVPTAGREELTPMLTVEWVAQGGKRLWIVRASHELAPGTTSLDAVGPLLASLASIALTSNTLSLATTLTPTGEPSLLLQELVQAEVAERGDGDMAALPEALRAALESDLQQPAWWNGVCNIQNYRAATGKASFPLGSGFQGVVPCGPIPGPSGERVVFFPDADGDFGPNKHGHGEFEFQCVELSMRYMQLAYGITAYPGNGSQVVPNFRTKSKPKDRDKMVIIPNGKFPPAPVAGDILSYGPPTTIGHTSVCIGSNVDSQGNGTITVMEQNNSKVGKQDLKVVNWEVRGSPAVTSFLHPKGAANGGNGGGGGNGGPPPVTPDPVHFPQTGQFVGFGFKALWFAPGNGVFLCGYPLTGEQAEGNLTVQYFENVKMEFMPGIQPRFGPVGEAYVQQAQVQTGTDPTGPGTRNFPATGHRVGGDFLALFDKYGEAVCGPPITGELNEGGLTVQYFRNVRMEQTPGMPARFGAVGRLFLKATGAIP